MLTFHQWGSGAYTWEQFHRKCSRIQSMTWIRIYTFGINATSPRGQWVNLDPFQAAVAMASTGNQGNEESSSSERITPGPNKTSGDSRCYEAHDIGETAMKNLRSMWLEQQLCDYTIITADKKEFHVHRTHLACVSDYIKTMLTGKCLDLLHTSMGKDSC